jgi:hypothetical protein
MIHLDVEQGSMAWRKARLGIPTASQFHRILTPKTRKMSSSAIAYAHELLAEWILQVPLDSANTGFMARGKDCEAEAVRWFEFEAATTTMPGGFMLRDDGKVGCSPDRLIGDEGGLEIKTPGAPAHIGNLLGMADEYQLQVQGGMWLCERHWWYLVSYNPEMPSALLFVTRDDELIADLENAVNGFIERLDAMKERLQAMGCGPIQRRPIDAICHGVREDGRWCLSTDDPERDPESGSWLCRTCRQRSHYVETPVASPSACPPAPREIEGMIDYVFDPKEFTL